MKTLAFSWISCKRWKLAGSRPLTWTHVVQELLSRFRSFVEEQTAGKDPNKVRIVVEW